MPDPDVIKCHCKDGAIDCSPQVGREKSGVIPEDKVDPLQQGGNNQGNYLLT